MIKIEPINDVVVFIERKVEARAGIIQLNGGADKSLATKYGIVKAIGDGVTKVKVGDKISVDWAKVDLVYNAEERVLVVPEDGIYGIIIEL